MLKRPCQASRNHYSKLLLSGTVFLCDQSAHEQAAGFPLHITNFLEDKMQLVMFMVLANGSEQSNVLTCRTVHHVSEPQLPPFTLSA